MCAMAMELPPPPREINAFRDVYWKLETKSKELVPYPRAVGRFENPGLPVVNM